MRTRSCRDIYWALVILLRFHHIFRPYSLLSDFLAPLLHYDQAHSGAPSYSVSPPQHRLPSSRSNHHSNQGPGPHGALPDRWEARDLRCHGFRTGGCALPGSALSASPFSQKPRWPPADPLPLYRERAGDGRIQGERYQCDSDTSPHRTDDADSPQGTEVRTRMPPGMDQPPPISVRSVCGTLEADRRHAGSLTVPADRSPIVRR